MEITAELAHKHLNHFNPFYDPITGGKSKDVPDDKRITVWMEEIHSFMIDDMRFNLGISELVATSWIEHDKLIELCSK